MERSERAGRQRELRGAGRVAGSPARRRSGVLGLVLAVAALASPPTAGDEARLHPIPKIKGAEELRSAREATGDPIPRACSPADAVARTFDGRRAATPAFAVLRLKVAPVRRAKVAPVRRAKNGAAGAPRRPEAVKA
jgi:hypothetical protein